MPGIKALNLPFLFTDSSHMFELLDGELGVRYAQRLQAAGYRCWVGTTAEPARSNASYEATGHYKVAKHVYLSNHIISAHGASRSKQASRGAWATGAARPPMPESGP